MYSLRKDLIPILVQPGYVPDGWLGALVGSKLFYDMTSEEKVEIQTSKLVKELGDRGRLRIGSRSQMSTPRSRSDRDSDEGQ